MTEGHSFSIPYGRQEITSEDVAAVTGVLQGDYLTQGPSISSFEEAFAAYVGAAYAVAVSNGTAALHLCAMVLGIKPGEKVITTPITFAASANCVRYCGGEVVFADIDPETYLLDINKVRSLLESSPKGTYKGIIPVDFAGRAVDMEAFRKLANQHDLWLIEDACHAPGGYFKGSDGKNQFCGNGLYADLAIFSFHPVKHIAAGEGGMITTNNRSLYDKLKILRTHGITKDPDSFLNSTDLAIGQSADDAVKHNEKTDPKHLYPGWYMEMQMLGYNYRLTDFQAALGNSQLKRADAGLKRRKKIACRYAQEFQSIPEITDRNTEALNHRELSNNPHAYHLYVVEATNRLELYNYLKSKGIFAQIHYIPVHLMPYYRALGWKSGDFPNAEAYYSRCISLPLFPSLSNLELDYVIDTIRSFYTNQ